MINIYQISKLYCITVLDINICLSTAGFTDDALASWKFLLQFSSAGDVVGMAMGVN